MTSLIVGLIMQNFSLVIVDLLMGHCDLALVRHIGIPAVLGYWSHQVGSFDGMPASYSVSNL